MVGSNLMVKGVIQSFFPIFLGALERELVAMKPSS